MAAVKAASADKYVTVRAEKSVLSIPGFTARLRTLAGAELLMLAIVLAPAAIWMFSRLVGLEFISFSDGVYTYVASVVAAHGPSVLYQHIALSQPPIVVLTASLFWKLSPGIEAIRVLVAGLGVVTVFLSYLVSRQLGLHTGQAMVVAGLVTLAPMRYQFGGLDGEAFLTPLLLLVILCLNTDETRTWLVGLLIGFGFLIKLTWAPLALVALIAIGFRHGAAAVARTATMTCLTALGLYLVLSVGFGWPLEDLWMELIGAESHSGFQLQLLPVILILVLAIWLPVIPLAVAGFSQLPLHVKLLTTTGTATILFAVKQGTFQNVLIPVEPLLFMAALVGMRELWSRRSIAARSLAVFCCSGLAVHAASVALPSSSFLPAPLSGEILNMNSSSFVERAARSLDVATLTRAPVMVNPLIALAAHRREVDNQADWFILHALSIGCASPKSLCGEWSRMTGAVSHRTVSAVSVDSNVTSFAPDFSRALGRTRWKRLLQIHSAPLNLTIWTH